MDSRAHTAANTASSVEPVRLRRDFVQDPHTLYRRLRSAGPAQEVIMWRQVRVWLVTRYAEARALLNDPRLGKDYARGLELFPPDSAGGHASPLSANMLHSDPPDHTRLRKLVSQAFTARAVGQLRPKVERIVDEALAALPTGRAVDLIEKLALPVPITVISEVLGVPEADRARFVWLTRHYTDASDTAAVREADASTTAYLKTLIAAKRSDPGDDLLSALVHASDDGDRLDSDELLAMVFLLILAGFETTVNLIGNGVLALLREPEQQELLRRDPALLPGAVEEFLRLESPLNTATVRFTREPVTVGEVEIPADELVMIALLSANHDDAQFAEPDRLDVTRDGNGHLAFGHGIHYCLGAPLARLEGEVLFGKLLARFGTIDLATDPARLTYRASTLMRGLEALPVRLDA